MNLISNHVRHIFKHALQFKQKKINTINWHILIIGDEVYKLFVDEFFELGERRFIL